jgi:dedicator of cytokinesis protein 3
MAHARRLFANLFPNYHLLARRIIDLLYFFQNKEFVYRGLEWEKIATFTQRLSAEFPNAQVSSAWT